MSTTAVETWAGADLSQIGPIYPMVGTEMILVIVGVLFWLGFHVLQARIERRELDNDEAAQTVATGLAGQLTSAATASSLLGVTV